MRRCRSCPNLRRQADLHRDVWPAPPAPTARGPLSGHGVLLLDCRDPSLEQRVAELGGAVVLRECAAVTLAVARRLKDSPSQLRLRAAGVPVLDLGTFVKHISRLRL